MPAHSICKYRGVVKKVGWVPAWPCQWDYIGFYSIGSMFLNLGNKYFYHLAPIGSTTPRDALPQSSNANHPSGLAFLLRLLGTCCHSNCNVLCPSLTSRTSSRELPPPQAAHLPGQHSSTRRRTFEIIESFTFLLLIKLRPRKIKQLVPIRTGRKMEWHSSDFGWYQFL